MGNIYQREFKNTGIKLSMLGMGCMRLPKKNPDAPEVDYEKAQEIIDYAYAHGINYYDTAYMYHSGDSELFLGQAMKKYPRDSFYLADKMPIWMANCKEDVPKIFEDQLKKCGVEYFDFYLMHSVQRTNWDKYVEYDVYNYLLEQKKKGRIRYLGFSFHDNPQLLTEVVEKYQFDFAQIQCNYVDWDGVQDAKGQYEVLEKHGLSVIVMEPVRGGALAAPGEAIESMLKEARPNESIASWAIRFNISKPNTMVVLSGMSNMEQIIDNIGTVTDFEPLTAEEDALLAKAGEMYRTKDLVPCTGCRYCMDCPFGLDIPKNFTIFNEFVRSENAKAFAEAMDALAPEMRATNCRACGKCATHCPQLIAIPDKMKMITEKYEQIKKQ